ncbi:alanyl-tRNA synthetase [Butyrivibrio fibrisolvens DSM 3071]|uniref:Alanine--tRNA ligase n=1 Tax=Butyrivibrio fibrisolvens DSM 3071 TaxID=1121131 RepID=A0A1M5ZIY5_BUTFI|nr:alanine--tRNA ligase [Butyrivibrio fibrisolvens]SHI24101.1 alanyl-tRNA synthetase [Butyrivibrio fibrisolvens DSM 3071]
MKQFTASELRKAWKQFYIDRGHVDCGAVSLVSDGSTGVMFNVAGMQPLMPYLLGKKHPMGTRLCNVQGCVRTNDIDSVGDKSHGTFFEMMGSWSLGDYFKKERCQWSFELLTQLFGFDADHLAATVFAGDENAPRDEEGAKYRIESGFKPENIYYLPAEDNWWGLEYGPCGPDSEMFYVKDVPDCGPNCGPGCHCGKYTEIGNDVFMQYEKHHDGHLTPLAQKNVDTGWGLERILAFLNGVDDVYKIDLHAPVIAYIEKESGIKYEADEKTTRSMRILADHTRTSVMLIGDEAKLLPSNTGAGYILRRLIRRAVRHARTLGLNKDQILGVAKIYIDEYKESYEHLNKNQKFVLTELEREIVRFESTLENGMKEFKKILDKTTAEGKKEISGKDAFFLYDTYGFPVELTVELAQEEDLTVDEEGFKTSMEEQKQKARDNQNFSANLEAGKGVFDGLDESVKVEFLGYDALGCDGTVVAMAGAEALTDELTEGQQGTIITDKTTFYGTMGGQVGDIGEILGANGAKFEVAEAIKVAGGRTAHVGKVVAGSFKTSDKVSLNVDAANRAKTCSNHSATHLLQKALQEVLGDSVEQAGSYQDPDKTRFDFSYHQAMTADEIKKVEDIVNAKIYEGLSVVTKEMSLEEAKKTGAMALFGEKYGDSVRVVNMGDWSIELCGGTHVSNTREIGQFKILSESGVAAGVRRIEAITGSNVIEFYKELERNTKDAAALLKATPETLADHIKKLQEELKALKSENESLKSSAAKDALGNAADDAVDVKGVKFVAKSLKDVDMNSLRELGDSLKESLGDCVVVLMSDNDGKVSIMTMASDSAVKKGAHAGNLVKEIAPMVGGGGGGRPNMAQAGGKNPAGIADALNKAQEVLANQIK